MDIGLDPRGKVVVDDSHNIRLHGAIERGHFDSVLECAASSHDGLKLETLLRATTWTAIEKGRALTMSISYKNKHLVQDLFDAQADVSQEIVCYGGQMIYTCDPATPLLLAVRDQDASLTRRLIKAGADLEHSKTVIFAVSTGNKQILRTLLEAGANVDLPASPRRERTALQLATEKGNTEVVDILLKAGANVNHSPLT